jgi:hypothetical protein
MICKLLLVVLVVSIFLILMSGKKNGYANQVLHAGVGGIAGPTIKIKGLPGEPDIEYI